MSTAIAMPRSAAMSPRSRARWAGAFQLLEALSATLGQVIILGRFLDRNDAAATAAHIEANQSLYWLGFVFSLLGVLFHIAWALFFYELMKPVSRTISSWATLVILVGCAVQAIAVLLYIAPLAILRSGASLGAFATAQQQALAFVCLRLNAYAFDIYLVFFGVWCLSMGYLIFRSTFLPKVLGVLLMISGLGWTTYLLPPLASQIFPVIALASALGEFPLELWLLVMAVNSERWEIQAGGSPTLEAPRGARA